MGAATPRRTRIVPAGSSVRSPHTNATSPTTASVTDSGDGCWPAPSSAAMPPATAKA